MSKNRLLHLAIGLAALPAAVNAQPANEQTSGGLEEVVVTAELGLGEIIIIEEN